MRLRNLVPAGLMLAVLAGCSGTTTATADESSVGMDSAAKSSCHGEAGKAGCADKAACGDKAKECAGKTECDKPAEPKTNE